jgi:hypothetical protein|tara:strand:+ start:33 stop:506 length:474 start_codon:yes stop_codon:yes gene_type:complete
MTVKALDFTTKERLKELVEDWTAELCLSLEQNYLDYHKRMITSNYERYNGVRPDLSDYAKEQLDAIENGTFRGKKFTFFEGKKYLKVIMNDYNDITKKYDGRGVHCFIDKFTGQVFKASSWKAPAKGVRFDMRIMRERALMHNSNFTDWAGGYLYAR